MKAFTGNLEHLTEANRDFRRVIYTGPHLQLVLMALQPGEEIGEEVHQSTDQFFRIEEGKGTVWINGSEMAIDSDMAVVIPAGARHNVRNTGKKTLKLYTLYAPPEHADGTVHRTRAEAEAAVEVQ
jgi:mannose-6-phosphate isomerase-like protein (cupin superfamily)